MNHSLGMTDSQVASQWEILSTERRGRKGIKGIAPADWDLVVGMGVGGSHGSMGRGTSRDSPLHCSVSKLISHHTAKLPEKSRYPLSVQ